MQGPDTRKSLLFRMQNTNDSAADSPVLAPVQQQAWAEFVVIYEPLIYRLARAKGLQHSDAQDMTQDVFATVGGAIDQFDPEAKGSFRGWLFRITRNLVINHLTRDKETAGTGKTDMQLLLQEQPAADAETETMFQVERRREIFLWAAETVHAQFQEDTWQAFWMTGVDGEAIEAVAKRLGKSPGAVRIARCRVLARLQDEVKKFEEDTGK